MKHLFAVLVVAGLAACAPQSQYASMPVYDPKACIWVSDRPDIDLVTLLGYRYPNVRLFHFEARNVKETRLPDCTRKLDAEVRWSEIKAWGDSGWTRYQVHITDASIISIDPEPDLQRPCGDSGATPAIAANIIKAAFYSDPSNIWEVRNVGAAVKLTDDKDYCFWRVPAEVRSRATTGVDKSWSPWRAHDFFINHADVMKVDPFIPYIHAD